MSVKHACDIMKLSTSGYYEWQCGNESPRQLRDRIGAQHIKEISHKHKGNYGARRIRAKLAGEWNIHMSRREISSLMAQNGLCAGAHCEKRVNTTDSGHNMLILDNLLKRQFDQSMSNKAWVTDTTYIRTMEGWLYLTVIIDLHSRRVVGWAMSDKIDALPSMSGGKCYDNACAESIFHSLKVERVYTLNVCATRELAKADILSYLNMSAKMNTRGCAN